MIVQKSKGAVGLHIILAVAFLILVSSLPTLPVNKLYDFGKKGEAMADISRISGAISRYKSRTNEYPVNQQALLVSVGGYEPELTSLPERDPWGNTNTGVNGTGGISAYCYARTEKGFAVWSIGRDKQNNSGGSGSSLPNANFSGDDVGIISE
ncbi:type II secretion system protein GspG [Sporomusa sphaeroides]|uniref:Bacterial type II secretion system protein G n=1 Tax=Sporomusa sphaeroides DSM 2875 TaxID=1337886 RepID=A0A1U7M9R5_9FIRM|nr:type II secretion system protein GspG [Sporomusa sphaeroides]OLS54289.1 type II secretion system protein G precursor [Sporomusa sphaeroides DSM 2875]CVK21669.1 Bacterial type II secretion system protein G [Sporomusa sphaeroides DSM 2875]